MQAIPVPHLGTHAWPEINKSLLTIVNDDIVDTVERFRILQRVIDSFQQNRFSIFEKLLLKKRMFN